MGFFSWTFSEIIEPDVDEYEEKKRLSLYAPNTWVYFSSNQIQAGESLTFLIEQKGGKEVKNLFPSEGQFLLKIYYHIGVLMIL